MCLHHCKRIRNCVVAGFWVSVVVGVKSGRGEELCEGECVCVSTRPKEQNSEARRDARSNYNQRFILNESIIEEEQSQLQPNKTTWMLTKRVCEVLCKTAHKHTTQLSKALESRTTKTAGLTAGCLVMTLLHSPLYPAKKGYVLTERACHFFH